MKDHLNYAVYEYKSMFSSINTDPIRHFVMDKASYLRMPETDLMLWRIKKVSTYTSEKTANRKAVEMTIKTKLEGRG